MNSSRPYLIRGLYDWIVDNDCTPYLLVDATVERVDVPPAYVENGKIVLNISPAAVDALDLGNDLVRFEARFGGSERSITVPVHAVLAVYARENGKGMMFPEDDGVAPPPDSGPPEAGGRKPSLKVVK